jgi:hypothetical protein
MALSAARPLFLELIKLAPCTPLELEQLRLERLRELRATIDALRSEQQAADPLLAWVLEQQNARETGDNTGNP